MILGIGTDIIEINRIEKAYSKNSLFIEKLFTEKEQEQLRLGGFRIESIAGMFAAKEAISKALGTGFRGFGFRDIEIIKDERGKPEVIVGEKILYKLNLKKVKFHVSISHNKDSAIAFAILEEV